MVKLQGIKWRWLIIGLVLVVVFGAGSGVRAWLFTDLPSVDDLSGGLHTPSIRITDRYGRALYEVIGEEAGRHTVVTLEQIPADCIEATIATEDANFYTNPGVDLRAIVRALWINVRGGEVISGGSTITQQVARNTLLDPGERAERTVTRKLRESILAYRLARRYSKDEILSLYLNQTYYGNLAYGIDAAARAYFGKGVDELDLAECALIAGLPQAPALYDPLTDPEAATARQAVVLGLMADAGLIDAQQRSQAEREVLAFASERYQIEAPHFVAAVYTELESRIDPEIFYAGGLTVRTTLDLDWQREAGEIARRHLDLLNKPLPGDPPHNASGAALVAMNPYTGEVLTMLGSPDFFNVQASGAVNMALAPRQPGSALKPFTYAAAMDPTRSEPLTAASMILDVRTSFVTKEGYSYTPVNYDRTEHGPVLAREALASSYNIPAVIVLQRIGLDALFTTLARLGISTLDDPSAHDLALTLGGGDIRLLELTAAYGALANGGQAVRPILILDVTDTDGNVIYSGSGGLAEQVIDQRVAWLITDILSDNLARAPTFTTHSILQIGRPAAVKTGTTTDYRDNWTLGYTPNLVVGVWVGNPDNSPMVAISGVSGAGPIWHQFMRAVLLGTPEHDFGPPEGLVRREVCTLSGLLPTEDCPFTRNEWFIPGTEPTEYDTFWRRIGIDAATGLPADETTPPERIREDLFLDLPVQAQEWARRERLNLLPEMFGQGVAHSEAGLIIVAPDHGSIYRIDPALPASGQRLRIAAVGPAGLGNVTVYVDGQVLARFERGPYEVFWEMAVGEHRVWATGTTSEGERIRSEDVVFVVNGS